VARDEDEVTVVTEEANVGCIAYDSDVKWFSLIEIRVSLPFVAKGFLAAVTGAIAGKDLNNLVVSTFSKAYFLVREESLQTALGALEEFGFPVARDEV
jgi:hypothetical protein